MPNVLRCSHVLNYQTLFELHSFLSTLLFDFSSEMEFLVEGIVIVLLQYTIPRAVVFTAPSHVIVLDDLLREVVHLLNTLLAHRPFESTCLVFLRIIRFISDVLASYEVLTRIRRIGLTSYGLAS